MNQEKNENQDNASEANLEAFNTLDFKEVETPEAESHDLNNQLPLYPQYQGLGGWLILVGIGIIISPIKILLFLFNNLLLIFTSGSLSMLTDPSSEAYSPFWIPLLAFEGIGNIAFLALGVLLIVFFFQKRKMFPKLYIIVLIANIVFLISDELLSNLIPYLAKIEDTGTVSDIVRTVISCLIWIPYMLCSKRVKSTFIR